MGTRNQTSSMVFDWNIIINCKQINKQNEKESKLMKKLRIFM